MDDLWRRVTKAYPPERQNDPRAAGTVVGPKAGGQERHRLRPLSAGRNRSSAALA
eukprot:CAMPEP_0172607460 /NCGR_PEP_ID=MMETSP1068-20121228/27647_1 /TAXON_ID=35684 /ORGANISM="Pseudopedinella elastica, Strain CCMP716" /LENGTH=54 /DNA_ID=CAMNT_0013410477 /DNA_START=54 /DNA_END=214 /DNA_ORIENTATION=-